MRGCSGFGVMRSSGTLRTPAGRSLASGEISDRMAGERSRSSASRRAAVPRKSGLAKLDYLPRETAIGPRRFRVSGVRRDGSADERCLAESNGLLDHVFEDVMVTHVAQLLEHVAAEDGAAV